MKPDPVLHFDRYELQVAQRRLLRDGDVVPLRARAFDLLVVLAERAGRLVTKDELLDLVWPGVVVEENNIAAQVAALRRALNGDLIVTVPGRGYRFAVLPQASNDSSAAPPAAAPVAGQRLFGRDDDLAQLTAALERPGCVTLVGPGGVGKTALAQALAARWPYGGTPIWVDLAALTDAGQLLAALCRALDLELPESDAAAALARALGPTARLLVLDNAEHLVEAVADRVTPLLAAAPHLRLLVTSQVPLAIAGEQVLRIDPLALPAADASDEQALQSGALAMFVDRVRAADPRYRYAPDGIAIARALCAELDGLPLALEMAAARVPLLGLQRVRDALAERFALLRSGQRDAPSRHRTLQSALDWSHDLLAPEEQAMFDALGVFSAGFTLDLAVAVASDDVTPSWDAIDRLAALVDRSLVYGDHRDPPRYALLDRSLVYGDHRDPPRYALLETMRSYALGRLSASGREGAVRVRLASALEALLTRANEAPRDASGSALRQQAVDEMHNVRGALAWTRRHDPAQAARLALQAVTLATFTPWRRDATDWLAGLEPLLPEMPLALQAMWWRIFATQMLFRGSPRAVSSGQRAAEVCRAAGDEEGLFWSLVALARSLLVVQPGVDVAAQTDELSALLERHPEWPPRARAAALGTLGLASEGRGDYTTSLAQRLEELEVSRSAGLAGSIDGCEGNIAGLLARLGRHDEALARLRAHMLRVGDKDSFNVAHLWLNLVDVLLHAGRPDEALAEAAAALAACRHHAMPEMSDFAALIAAQQGRWRAGALLLGHARRTYSACGGKVLDESEDSAFVRALALLGDALDEPTLARLQIEGEALDEAAADSLLFAAADPA